MVARILNLPEWLLILAVVVLSLSIVVPLTMRSIRRGMRGGEDINVAGWALGFVGGAFIFAGTFTTVTVWDVEKTHAAAIMAEFGAATSFAQDLRNIDPAFTEEAQGILLEYADVAQSQELGEIAGLPTLSSSSGDPAAERALDSLFYAIDTAEQAGTLSPDQAAQLMESYEDIAAARLHRLSLRSPIPTEIAVLLLVVSAATLVTIGTFPSGGDTRVRWTMSFTGAAVVITVLSTVIMLVSPGSDMDARRGPVDDLRSWIETN